MKKFVSILLALALCLSWVQGVGICVDAAVDDMVVPPVEDVEEYETIPSEPAQWNGEYEVSAVIDTGATVRLIDADQDGYFEIGTADELAAFSKVVLGGDTDICGKLTADIDMNPGYVFHADGSVTYEGKTVTEGWRVWYPIGHGTGSYTGSFDGGDHTVSGLTFRFANIHTDYEVEMEPVGMFGRINGGTVQNVNVTNFYYESFGDIGGIAGYLQAGTVRNCSNQGQNISSDGENSVGGVVGHNREGTVANCTNTCTITGDSFSIGGIAGCSYGGSITDCSNMGQISSEGGMTAAGGIVGNGNGATVTGCTNTGEVYSDGECASGIVGFQQTGTITDCTNEGAISAGNDDTVAGGVVSVNASGTVTNCVNSGTITGDSDCIGGVAGTNYQGTVTHCSNTGIINATGSNSTAGGVVGYHYQGMLTACSNEGPVGSVGMELGGVVGVNHGGTLENSYNMAAVTGECAHSAGGVAGTNFGGVIVNSYNTGAVFGPMERGSLVGMNRDGILENSYYLVTEAQSQVSGEMTEDQFASGEVCWLLRQGCTVSESTGETDADGNIVYQDVTHSGDAWGQNIDGEGEKERYPVISNAAVYYNRIGGCTEETFTYGYSNTDRGLGVFHKWTTATCVTPQTCAVCGETEGEVAGHSFQEYVSNHDANCFVDGTKTAICTKCGTTDTIVDEDSAIGHMDQDADNFCDDCGVELTQIKPNSSFCVMNITPSATVVKEGDIVEYTITAVSTYNTYMDFVLDIPDGMTFVEGSGKVSEDLQSEFRFYEKDLWNDPPYLFISISNRVSFPRETVLLTFSCKVDTAGTYEMQLQEFNVPAGIDREAIKTLHVGTVTAGHSFGAYISDENATCTVDGTKTAQCAYCGATDTITDTGSALGHTWVEATCTTAKTCTVCGTAEGEALGHSYQDGKCVRCGEVKASVVPTITLRYPTLSFEDVIVMNVYYAAENLEDVVEMGLITYSQKMENYSVETAEKVLPGYTWSETDGFYFSSTDGIAAKDLDDTIYFAVYAQLADGNYAYTNLIGYSPSNYAYNLLKTGNEDMKALVAAMLNYGAAAQVYFSYNTDALVNTNLTEDQKALVAAYREDMISNVVLPDDTKKGEMIGNGGYTKRYPTISFEGAFCINYYFVPSAALVGDITMYVWNQADYDAAESLSKDNATEAITMTLGENGEYAAVVDGIAAKDLDSGVYVAFCYSDGTTEYCSGVIGYSIGAYCKNQAAKTGPLAELAAATAVYGYYAKRLFVS